MSFRVPPPAAGDPESCAADVVLGFENAVLASGNRHSVSTSPGKTDRAGPCVPTDGPFELPCPAITDLPPAAKNLDNVASTKHSYESGGTGSSIREPWCSCVCANGRHRRTDHRSGRETTGGSDGFDCSNRVQPAFRSKVRQRWALSAHRPSDRSI